MTRAAVDLHIHSALSPCSEEDMTPNNIVNMSFIKGIDIIAVTDHNHAGNARAVMKCAKKRGVVAVPGMEVATREEVHLVCLFPGLDEVLKMQDSIYKSLPDIKNRPDIYGEQLLMDENDDVTGYVEKLLITGADMGVEDVVSDVQELGGVVIPAHVDRESYSMLWNLGDIPDDLSINYLELSAACDKDNFLKRYPKLRKYNFIKSSDAHSLQYILERESFIELEEISIECLIKTLRDKRT